MMFAEAIAAAIAEEMQRDSSVIFYGQNMAMTERDPFLKKFGKNRVRITPISETAEMGAAVGAAMTGLRPIVELYMAEFMLVAFDQVINEAPRLRYMSGGQVKVPLVFKAGFGFAAGWAGQHSNCTYHAMMGIPGLKLAIPSTPADAKGLMTAAIRDDNPVVYLHHYMLTIDKGEVPDGDYVIPFGVADIKRSGTDVTIVATAWMVKKSLAAADRLAQDGISAEVIDPRTLAPLDVDTILASVKKTGRLVLVDQATRHASAAAIIAAEVSERGFKSLRAPIKLVTALDTSIPYSEPLESYVLPNEDKIVQAVKSVVLFGNGVAGYDNTLF
jgi:pyruvate dehydrogenase E1 component beta subunit